MTLYDREDRIECDECDTWAEHKWHEKADDFEDRLLAAQSKLEDYSRRIEAISVGAERWEAAAKEASSRLDTAVNLLRCVNEAVDSGLAREVAKFVSENGKRLPIDSVRGILK